LHCCAQDKTDFGGLSIGPAIPVGAFAASNNTYDKAGYALTGVDFNANYMHRLNGLFGIAANAFSVVNGARTTDNNSYSYASPSYFSFGIMFGGYIKPKNFPVYVKAMLGFCVVSTPYMDIVDNAGNDISYDASAAVGGVYSIGLGSMIPLGKHWAVTVSADYKSCLARPSVTSYNYNSYGGNNTNTLVSYNENVISIQAGIGYQFNTGKAKQRGHKIRYRH